MGRRFPWGDNRHEEKHLLLHPRAFCFSRRSADGPTGSVGATSHVVKQRGPKGTTIGERSPGNLDFRGIHKHTAITAVIRD